jgi:hypothetical protein
MIDPYHAKWYDPDSVDNGSYLMVRTKELDIWVIARGMTDAEERAICPPPPVCIAWPNDDFGYVVGTANGNMPVGFARTVADVAPLVKSYYIECGYISN